MSDDVEFEAEFSSFVAALRAPEDAPDVISIVTHDNLHVADVPWTAGMNFARLRHVICDLPEISWSPPARPGGIVLELPLDFEFLLISEDAGTDSGPNGEKDALVALAVTAESQTAVVPSSSPTVTIRFRDVAVHEPGVMNVTQTISPLGPVGTQKAATSAVLLAAAKATRDARAGSGLTADALLEQMALDVHDGVEEGNPHVPVHTALRVAMPLACFKCYRKCWLYRDPRHKRRTILTISGLFIGLLCVIAWLQPSFLQPSRRHMVPASSGPYAVSPRPRAVMYVCTSQPHPCVSRRLTAAEGRGCWRAGCLCVSRRPLTGPMVRRSAEHWALMLVLLLPPLF